MANNCDNHVTFTGKKEDIETLYQRFQKYDESEYFTHFAEMVLGEPLSDISTSDWSYSYGTKWWDFELELGLEHNELTVSGDSAWSPPLQLIAEITKVFKVRAEGSYYEPGMDFAGNYTAEDGALEDNELTCFEYDLLSDRNYAIGRLIEDINDETYELEYAEGEFKKYLTEDEWNEVLTETNNK